MYGRISKSARNEAVSAAKLNQIAINIKKDQYYIQIINAIAKAETDLYQLRNKRNPTRNNDEKAGNLDLLLFRLFDLKEAYEVEHIFENTEKVYANLARKVGNTRRNTGRLAHTLGVAARKGLNNKGNTRKRLPTALATPRLGPSTSASNYQPLGPSTSASNYQPLGPSTSTSNYKINNGRNTRNFLRPSPSGTVSGLPKINMPARAGAGGPQKNWWL